MSSEGTSTAQADQRSKDEVSLVETDATAATTESEDVTPFELCLHLPQRPLLPANHAAAGLPETPSPLRVAVTPQETLNELRVTITDSPEGYWLGAFCFRRPSSNQKQVNGSSRKRLGERVSEWTELKEIFKDVSAEDRVLHIAHVAFNKAEARAHVQRLRELLSGGQVDPSSIGIDGGISVQDAIRNADLWAEEQKASVVIPTGENSNKKQRQASNEPPETIKHHNFDDFQEWKHDDMSQLIPPIMRKDRSLPQCLRHLSVSAWNPPSHQLQAQGHFLYLYIVTLEGEHLYITASSQGFYVNNSTASRFDSSPRTSPNDYSSCSLFDVLCGVSPLFLANFAKLFQDPVSQRDYFAVVPISNCLPSHPWLARNPSHVADLLRSQSAFILTGATSIDTLDGTRDWNDEIQSTRELPRSNLQERLMRDRVLNRVYAEFTLAAARAVPKVAAGEVQAMNPMDKNGAQMFIVNNLFISKGLDGVDIYPMLGGDEAAHVAVSKDVQGIRCLNNLDIDGVCLLGTVVIDWMGERWVAQSVVPGLFRRREEEEEAEVEVQEEEMKDQESKVEGVSEDQKVDVASKLESKEDTQIVYGGVDGPETIKEDRSFHSHFAKVAKNLHLALHDVVDAKGDAHSLWLSVDCKGLRGADGRKYALDLARLNLVDIEWLEKDYNGQIINAEDGNAIDMERSYPHKMTLLRPELVEIYWDSEFRNWAREELVRRKEEKEAGDVQEENKEPERLDASLFQLTFNPDAFVEFKLQDGTSKVLIKDEDDPTVAAVRKASKYLREVSIPRLVSDVAIGTQTVQDGLALTRQMHSRGINMRYLGVIANLCHPLQRSRLNQDLIEKAGPGVEGLLLPLKKIVLQEMVVRSAKRIFRRMLKQGGHDQICNLVSHYLNCLVGDKVQINPMPIFAMSVFAGEDDILPEWVDLSPEKLQEMILVDVAQRYRYKMTSHFFNQEMRREQVLREICICCGIQLRLKRYNLQTSFVQNGGHTSEDSHGESSNVGVTTIANTSTSSSSSKKKKKGSSTKQASIKQVTAFVPEDILNLLPIIKDSTPKSTLAEEAFEAGRISMSRGDRALGFDLMTEGISFHEQVYGVVHPEVARCYGVFATILHHYASILAVEQAEKQKQLQSSGSTEKVPPDELGEHISIATALRYQRQAVTISERSLGLDNDETLGHYVNLAVLERLEGNLENSLRCQNRVLVLLEIIYGEDHPDVITALNNVALTLQTSRQFDKSLKVYRASYDMALRSYGKDSINTGYLGHELSQAYTLTGDLKKAIEVEKGVNRVFEERLGKEDHMTKESSSLLNNLAASAVRIAKMDAQQKEATRLGLTSQLRGNSRSSRGISSSSSSAAVQTSPLSETTRSAVNGDLSNQSLDDLVKFIQGSGGVGNTASSSSSGGGTKKSTKGGMKKLGRK